MTDFLVRTFIRDNGDIHNPVVRQRYGLLSGVVGIVLNLLLSAGKLLAGVSAASIAITADALNNLSDAGSSVVTLVGFKLAGQKADEGHPFGHGRIEYLAGLLVSLIIMLVGLELGKGAIGTILHPEPVVFSLLSVVVLAVSIGVKLWLCLFNRSLGNRIGSAAMRATAADSLADVAATSAVLAGTLAGHFFQVSIDGWAGIVVAVFILRAGWGAAKDTLNPLLGTTPDPKLVKSIRDTVLSHDPIVGMHDLVIHDYGPGRAMMSLHAEVPMDEDIMEAHDAIDHVERELHRKFGIETSIHMDPVAVNDQELDWLRRQVSELVQVIEPAMSIHDFRITRGPQFTNLIFDVAVPYKCTLSDDEVRARISRALRAVDPNYHTVLQIDRVYTGR